MLPPLSGLLAALLAPTLLALAASQTAAQAPRRDFSCVGAEQLEDDVFAIPFRSGNAQVTEAARSGLAAAAQLIKAEPDRDVCVLGHSDREGGQASNVRLAASRARAVAEALTAQYGIPAARLRSEARVAGFSRSTENRTQRNVTIVVLPARAPEPAPKPPAKPQTPATPPSDSKPPAPQAPASQPPVSQPSAPETPASPPAAAPAKPQGEKPPADKPEAPKSAAEPKTGSPDNEKPATPAPSTPPEAPGEGVKPPPDEKNPDQPGSTEAPKQTP
ncbi:OmpA family protein [Roseomonas gilardii subsp. gilardii]|uniref:OmpA family protein n=1 Tax=Roseomonas gilardii TaxID=257708 RepID=UPI001FF84639|nr:OmpA family protein [Roseomonas gilardii]UPG72726.1 OmpA family protein [Roseomonas gilardii subsp. gilardii]